MNPSEYRSWIERAFLFVEGKLLQRSAEESPTRITEDFVRIALIDGLKAAKPTRANDVQMEVNVPWNNVPNVRDPTREFGKGRSKQHDVAVIHAGLVQCTCELKWLKSKDTDAIMEDLWKLALTHGCAPRERDCPRTFLLVGGMRDAFQATLADLRRHNIPLRWSPQGRANAWPQPSTVKFGNLANQTRGFETLRSTLKRRDNYYRTPPVIWWEMRCSALARSYKTIRGAEWKIVLLELDYRRPCSPHQVDWSNLGDHFP
jgi:hypothetical protein